jgi:signal transduction histidine kinase
LLETVAPLICIKSAGQQLRDCDQTLRRSELINDGRVLSFTFLLVLLLATPASAAPLLLDASREYSLAGHLEVLSDPGGDLTLAEVAGPAGSSFRPLPGFLGLGYGSRTVWLRFTISRTAAYHDECYLRLGPAYLDHLTVYLQEGTDPAAPGSYREFQLGDHQPVSSRPIKHPLFVVPLRLPILDSRTVYLRLRSTSALELFGSIHPPAEMASAIDRNTLYGGAYLGVTLAIVLVNLIYFLRTRDPVIGYYVLYVIALSLNYLGAEGLIVLLWPAQAHRLADYLIACGVGSALIFIALFAMRLFNTGREPAWPHRYFQYVIVVGLLPILAVAPGWYGRVAPFVMLNSLFLIMVMTGLSISLVQRGELGGKIYLLAFAFSNIGFAVTFLRLLTVLPLNSMTYHALQIGTVLNMVLISLAMTERLHAAKKQAVAASLGAEARAVKLAAEMTVELWRKQQELTLALQKEQELLQRRTSFLEMITHEYRTPLSIIRTNLDILEDHGGPGSGTLRPYLDKMRRGVVRLVEVMEVALARVRMEELRPGAKLSPMLLAPLLREALEVTKGMQPERRFETAMEEGDWQVCGDDLLLKTAILNLLENACKYSPPDTPIEVALDGKAEKAVIRIRDHGQGIPESQLDKVFDKYYRGAGSSGSSGAGVGLHLVRRIIEQHRGSVSLAGEESGTTATVVLPLLQAGESCR